MSPVTETEEFDARLLTLARLIREESEALLLALPDAVARQWSLSPVPKPREDTPQRASGDRPADPTADTVADPRRLAVRAAVLNAEKALRDAAVALRGSRLAVERSVARFDGEGRP